MSDYNNYNKGKQMQRNGWQKCKLRGFHDQLLWEVTPTDAQPTNWPVPLNSIHENYNNPSANRAHSLITKKNTQNI